jgi:hypothetical protein
MQFGKPTEQQLALINKLSRKEFTDDDVFVFGGKSAGDRIIENRYIQLSKELLQTFVDDSKKGVSWLLNHSWASYSEPVTIFGRTFDARIVPSNEEGETVELQIDKFIPRSDTLKNGRSANSVIEDIENGILFDTSIGWGSNKMVCSICNMEYYGGGCTHWRGKTYEDADGNQKLCYVIAKNPGFLMEESGVFDGAYRGAGISMCKTGDIIESQQGKFVVVDEFKELEKDTQVLGLYTSKGELMTFVKKSEHKKVVSLATENNTDTKGCESMEKFKELFQKIGFTVEEGKEVTLSQVLEHLSTEWEKLTKTEEPKEEFLSAVQTKEALGNEMSAEYVLKYAKEGIAYNKSTIENALSLGVKALGNAFTKETWETTFATMGTQDINKIAETWKAQAIESLKAGQRFSTSDTNTGIESKPDEAFVGFKK